MKTISKRAARVAGLVSLAILCSSAAHAAVPKILINAATPNAGAWGPGWIIRTDNRRQWISGECRAQLERVGVRRYIQAWSSIRNYAQGSFLGCGSLVWQAQQAISSANTTTTSTTTTPSTTTSSGSVSFRMLVNTQDTRGEGWVLHSNNKLQWVGSSCRNDLENAGINVTRTNWSGISQYAKGAYVPCVDMEADLLNSRVTTTTTTPTTTTTTSSGGGSNESITLMTYPQESGGSGWVRLNNTRQWVNAECRQRLLSANINQFNTNWATIRQYQQSNALSCSTLVALVNSPENINSGIAEGGATGDSFRTSQCMGMNDDFLGSWDGGHIAADAFKGSRGPFLQDYKTPAPTDSNRWPVGNQFTVFVLGEGVHTMEKANPWVLIPYQQSGAWVRGPSNTTWDLPGASYRGTYTHRGVVGHELQLGRFGQSLKIYPGNLPSTPRNRWHLVPKNMANAYMEAMVEQNFNYIFDTDKYGMDESFPLLHTAFKNHMKDFCRIRYMIGSDVNTLNFSGYERDRNKPAYPSFDLKGGDGRPYEWKVWIANHLGINVWHTDHIKTWEALKNGDRYLHNQAQYYRDKLKGNLVREYGNEIWNQASPFGGQTNYVWQSAPFADFNRSDSDNMNWSYGVRTYDTAGVWESVWETRRQDLDLTVGAHTPSFRDTPERLIGPNGEPWYKRADSLALTFYIGSIVRQNDATFQDIERRGVQAVIENHAAGVSSWKTQISNMAGTTLGYVNRFHLYEGASHLVIQGYNENDARNRRVGEATTAYLNTQTYHNHMAELFNFWKDQNYAGEAMWFNLYGVNTPKKPFALYRSTWDTQTSYSGAGSYVRSHANRFNN